MKKIGIRVQLTAILILLVSCHSGAQTQPNAVRPMISGLPATFIGTLLCADCPGIVYQINLLPDQTFASRMIYQERNSSFDEQGSWEISKDGGILILKTVHGRPQQFSMPNADTLRQLDSEGREIQSKFNYDLKRAPAFASLAGK